MRAARAREVGNGLPTGGSAADVVIEDRARRSHSRWPVPVIDASVVVDWVAPGADPDRPASPEDLLR